MTREQLVSRAQQRGFSVHESVTDEMLAAIHPKMLNGRPEKITRQVARACLFDVDRLTIDEWIHNGYRVASYDLGKPGDLVTCPPIADEQLMIVTLPSYEVVAVIGGQGADTETGTAVGEMSYTILRRAV